MQAKTTIVESETVLVETIVDQTEGERLKKAFRDVTGDKTRYVARRSSFFLNQD